VCDSDISYYLSYLYLNPESDRRPDAQSGRDARGNGPGTMPGTQSTMRRAHPHEFGHLPPMQFISAVWCTWGELTCARYSAPHVPRSLVDTSPLRIHPPVACTETHSMPEQYRAPALSRFAQCVHASTPAATRTLPTPAATTQQPNGERERGREGVHENSWRAPPLTCGSTAPLPPPSPTVPDLEHAPPPCLH